MTVCLITQTIPNRSAQPHRPNRLMLDAPIDRANCSKRRSTPPRKMRPCAETFGFVRYRRLQIADSVSNQNALSP
jgi:hypothetical protein